MSPGKWGNRGDWGNGEQPRTPPALLNPYMCIAPKRVQAGTAEKGAENVPNSQNQITSGGANYGEHIVYSSYHPGAGRNYTPNVILQS